jgi:hypothetical protein
MAKHLSLIGFKGITHEEAYKRVLPEAMLLSEREVRKVNLSIDYATTVALATVKQLPPFKAELRALTGFPAERVEHLEDYALALYSAHLRYNFSGVPVDNLAELSEAGNWWRQVFLADVKSLLLRNRLREERLKGLRRGNGYRNLAHDLGGLAQIYKSDWEHLKDHTSFKFAQLEDVERLALDLTTVIAMRSQANEKVEKARDIRARMFTLLVGVYDEVRRGLEYTRWDHRDAKKIAPPLRRPRRPSESSKKEPART